MNITEETSKQVGTFMEIMRSQPLSLALVAMNLLLVGYIFYSGSTTLTQRRETVDLIVAWQRETDKLMASCVSSDIMKMVLDALERDRELYRRVLPHSPLGPQSPPAPQPSPGLQPQSQHILFQLPP